MLRLLPWLQMKAEPSLAGMKEQELKKAVMPFAQMRMKETNQLGPEVWLLVTVAGVLCYLEQPIITGLVAMSGMRLYHPMRFHFPMQRREKQASPWKVCGSISGPVPSDVGQLSKWMLW